MIIKIIKINMARKIYDDLKAITRGNVLKIICKTLPSKQLSFILLF